MKTFIAAILIVLFLLVLARPAYSTGLTVTLTTDRQAVNGNIYAIGEIVSFAGNVSDDGVVVQNGTVLFEVDRSNGQPLLIRTLTTGQTPAGPWNLQVVNVTPTDGAENPDYTFSPGDDAGFSVAVQNNGGLYSPAVVTLSLVFSNGAPFKFLTMFNGTLAPGQISTIWTYPVSIPTNAVKGQVMAYASIFNTYPKSGGVALSPGTSASFNISSSSPRSPVSSGFNLGVSLTPSTYWTLPLGNYTAYATILDGVLFGSVQTTFTVKLPGDVNGDGVVNMKDIAIIARAFGSHAANHDYPGEPASSNWNPAADISGSLPYVPDGIVNMKDIAVCAREFGMVA